jgi:hypothetical protein
MKSLQLLCLLGLTASVLSAGTVFSDDFSDNDRAGWFSSTKAGISASSGALVIDSGRSVQTGFTLTEALDVGDYISLSFQVSFSTAGDANSGFRFGLFNSEESDQPSSDGNTAYSDYNGIIVATNPGATTGSPASFRYRTPSVNSTALMTTASGYYTTIGENGATAVAFPTATVLDVEIALLRTLSGLNLSFSIINGTTILQSYSVDYSSPTTYSFDVLGISSTNAVGAMTIDNVRVSLIPEASAYSFMAGACCLIGASIIRRRV